MLCCVLFAVCSLWSIAVFVVVVCYVSFPLCCCSLCVARCCLLLGVRSVRCVVRCCGLVFGRLLDVVRVVLFVAALSYDVCYVLLLGGMCSLFVVRCLLLVVGCLLCVAVRWVAFSGCCLLRLAAY